MLSLKLQDNSFMIKRPKKFADIISWSRVSRPNKSPNSQCSCAPNSFVGMLKAPRHVAFPSSVPRTMPFLNPRVFRSLNSDYCTFAWYKLPSYFSNPHLSRKNLTENFFGIRLNPTCLGTLAFSSANSLSSLSHFVSIFEYCCKMRIIANEALLRPNCTIVIMSVSLELR